MERAASRFAVAAAQVLPAARGCAVDRLQAVGGAVDEGLRDTRPDPIEGIEHFVSLRMAPSCQSSVGASYLYTAAAPPMSDPRLRQCHLDLQHWALSGSGAGHKNVP